MYIRDIPIWKVDGFIIKRCLTYFKIQTARCSAAGRVLLLVIFFNRSVCIIFRYLYGFEAHYNYCNAPR